MHTYIFRIAKSQYDFDKGKFLEEFNTVVNYVQYIKISFQSTDKNSKFYDTPIFWGSKIVIKYFLTWIDCKRGLQERFNIKNFSAQLLYEILCANRDTWCFEIETDDESDFDSDNSNLNNEDITNIVF